MTSTIKNISFLFVFVSVLVFSFSITSNVNAWTTGCTDCGSTPTTPTTPSTPDDDTPTTPTCNISLNVTEVDNIGDSYVLTWNGAPTSASFYINGTAVADSGSATFHFTGPNYDRFHMTGNNGGVTCEKEVRVIKKVAAAPTCDSFTASPNSLPNGGGLVNLKWSTTNATNASIDGQSVAGNSGAAGWDVNVTSSKTFTLNLSNSVGSVSCTASVTVQPPVTPSTPSCVLDASPSALTSATQGTTLTWSTTNAVSATINQTVGAVTTGTNQTKVVIPGSTKTYTMTVTNNAGQTATCQKTVTVTPTGSNSPTCTLDVSNSSVTNGSTVNLTWTTDNATAVSITNVGTGLALDGNSNVIVNGATTYTLTATKGSETVTCAKTVTIKSTGGGGSSSPKCTLKASKTKVNGKELITLTWDTSRTNEITLYAGSVKDGVKLYNTTNDDIVDEGSFKVLPTKDTTYTLLAEKGSKDRTCTVKVDKDTVIVTSVRDQGKTVTGIALTHVPYTGFEAGPALTSLFYTLLALWGLFVAYNFAVKKDSILGFSLKGAFPRKQLVTSDLATEAATSAEEVSQAAAYVAQATEVAVPANLPTGDAPLFVGQAAYEMDETPTNIETEFTEIENRAHAKHVLLSSDAIRYFVAEFSEEEQFDALDELIAAAKGEYPTEDGWVVLNLDRMQTLIDKKPTVAGMIAAGGETPKGVGSLAEAIVVGNVPGAYALLGHRPMIALADAAADLDAIYRKRQGGEASTSLLLEKATAALELNRIKAAIDALSAALDGIYTNEHEAVKMAIIKAVKEIQS